MTTTAQEARKTKLAMRNAAIHEFKNDLKCLTTGDIQHAINEVEETVDRETAWLEALCARRDQLEEYGKLEYRGLPLSGMTREQMIDIINEMHRARHGLLG